MVGDLWVCFFQPCNMPCLYVGVFFFSFQMSASTTAGIRSPPPLRKEGRLLPCNPMESKIRKVWFWPLLLVRDVVLLLLLSLLSWMKFVPDVIVNYHSCSSDQPAFFFSFLSWTFYKSYTCCIISYHDKNRQLCKPPPLSHRLNLLFIQKLSASCRWFNGW